MAPSDVDASETIERGFNVTKDDAMRAAQTEAVFREVNERIAESAERFESREAAFVCECADPTCTERVDAPLTEYESVREDGATFLVVPGHEHAAVERVVERRPRFAIVAKLGQVGAVARRLDPRTSTA